MNKSVSLDQVFEIENSVLDPEQKIKNLSIVKIKNMMYNVYISTEIKKLDGDADQGGDEGNVASGGLLAD